MQYGENSTRTFEIRNEGLFDFKYAICDFTNLEEKNKIREERKKEADERLGIVDEEKKEDPKDKKAAAKKETAKPAAKGKNK